MPQTQNFTRPWSGFREQFRQRPRVSVLVVALTLCLLGIGGYFLVAPHLSAQYHWWKADRCQQNYKFPEALQHLQCCLQVWPRSGATHFQMGRVYRRQGDVVAARQQLQAAYALRHNLDDLQLEFHLIEAQTGSVQAVEPILKKLYLVNDHPDQLLIYEALVKGYRQHNYFDQAYDWATRWIQHAPKDWYAYYLRALAQERGNQFRPAIDDFGKALELNPNSLDTRLHLADALLHIKRTEHALQQYEICLREQPDSPRAGLGKGKCLILLGRDTEALDLFQKLLTRPGADRDKDLADGFRMYGQLLWQHDQPDAAVPLLQKAVALAPTNAQANWQLAAVFRSLGQEAEAKRCEDKAQFTDRTYIRLDQIVGELGQMGRLETESARSRAAQLRYEAGMLLLRLGHDEDGIAWLLSASQLDPTHEPSKKAIKDYYSEKVPRFENAPAR